MNKRFLSLVFSIVMLATFAPAILMANEPPPSPSQCLPTPENPNPSCPPPATPARRPQSAPPRRSAEFSEFDLEYELWLLLSQLLTK